MPKITDVANHLRLFCVSEHVGNPLNSLGNRLLLCTVVVAPFRVAENRRMSGDEFFQISACGRGLAEFGFKPINESFEFFQKFGALPSASISDGCDIAEELECVIDGGGAISEICLDPL